MYKLPTPRRTGCHEIRAPVSYDATSRAGSVLVQMDNIQAARPPPTPWRPCCDYKFLAAHLPDSEREAYITRSEEWLSRHVTPPVVVKTTHIINQDPVVALMKKHWPRRPPIDESMVAWRAAGYTEAKIAKGQRYAKMLDATSDARQTALDEIFSKWNVTAKTVTKPKKAIKAVKKLL